MFNTVLFDIDGTLLNSEAVLLNAFNDALKDTMGIQLEIKNLKKIIGLNEKKAVALFSNDSDIQNQIIQKWSLYVKNTAHTAKLFPNVENGLKQLKNMNLKIGLVTSKTREHMSYDFDKLQINHLFDTIVTSDLVTFPKPDPEPLYLAIKNCHTTPQETLYVGDSYADMLCAKSANVPFALAGWGTKNKDLLYSASLCFFDFMNLVNFLTSKNNI